MMDFMDNNLNRKVREAIQGAIQGAQQATVQAQQATAQAQKETKDISLKVVQKETESMITNSAIASDTNSIGDLKQNSSKEMSKQLDDLKAMVTKILPTKTITVPDDLQKNRWGGKSENNGKKLSAIVTKNTWQSLFNVNIAVSNIDGFPLIAPVAVFVHDSYKFPDNVVYITPDEKNLITLSVLAYEAFTLGALLTDGTELELDLNQQSGYPADFYVK